MSSAELRHEDPFAPAPPDEEAELQALARAIRRANGFTLLIACCNRADQRDRLMRTLDERLNGLHVQRLAIHEPTPHLLDLLRDQVESPLPDALFVYGIEAWLPAGKEAEESPFVLNLNAARDYFPRDLPWPLVLWLPQHLLATIAHGAPDFTSARSGVFSFSSTPQALRKIERTLTGSTHAELLGLTFEERLVRVQELQNMLSEYEALSPSFRDEAAEARLMASLGSLLAATGQTSRAETLFRQALEIRTSALGEEHPATIASVGDLAEVLAERGQYDAAQALWRKVLVFVTDRFGPECPEAAIVLRALGMVLADQQDYAEAEHLLQRALSVCQSPHDPDSVGTARTLSDLGFLYLSMGRWAEAEDHLRKAISIEESALGPDHVQTAVSLTTLGAVYAEQGRHAEALSVTQRGLAVAERMLGSDHTDVINARETLRQLEKQSPVSAASPNEPAG